MRGCAEPFWGWPGWGHLGLALVLAAGLSAWWVLAYGGANYVTGLHSYRVRLHLDAELRVPFVPAAVLGYMSIYPLFWSAPFILRERRAVVAFAATIAAVIGAAGVCFLLLPADSLFPTPPLSGVWEGPIRFAKNLALAHNMMPSLHVAMSVTCIIVYARRAPRSGAAILWTWSLVIAASTIFLHQHYLIDVITGYALAWVMVRLLYDRWPTRSVSPSIGADVAACATVPSE